MGPSPCFPVPPYSIHTACPSSPRTTMMSSAHPLHHQCDGHQCSPLTGLDVLIALPTVPPGDSTFPSRLQQETVAQPYTIRHNHIPSSSVAAYFHHPAVGTSTFTVHTRAGEGPPLPQPGATQMPAAPRLRPVELPIVEVPLLKVPMGGATPTMTAGEYISPHMCMTPTLSMYVPPLSPPSNSNVPEGVEDQMQPLPVVSALFQHADVGCIVVRGNTPTMDGLGCIDGHIFHDNHLVMSHERMGEGGGIGSAVVQLRR